MARGAKQERSNGVPLAKEIAGMRSVIALLVALTVAVVGTTAIVLLTPESWKNRISVVLSSARTAVKSEKPAAETPAAKAAPAGKHGKTATARLSEPVPGVEQALTAAPAQATPLPFPTDRDIASGSPRANVVRQFGEPSAAVTLADAGRLMERYIYLDKSSRRQTFVILVNGRVVGSQTVAGFQ
jgi:hypothetical protein